MSRKIIRLVFCFSLMAGAVAFAQDAAEAVPEVAAAATVQKSSR